MLSNCDSIVSMNNANRKTLAVVFATPAPSSLEWRRIESLLVALGANPGLTGIKKSLLKSVPWRAGVF